MYIYNDERGENRNGKEGENGDYLASCMQITWFCVVSRRSTSERWWDGLLRCVGEDKVNAGKSKVMVMNGEEGLEREVLVDGVRLQHVSELKYLGYVFGRSRYGRCRM